MLCVGADAVYDKLLPFFAHGVLLLKMVWLLRGLLLLLFGNLSISNTEDDSLLQIEGN